MKTFLPLLLAPIWHASAHDACPPHQLDRHGKTICHERVTIVTVMFGPSPTLSICDEYVTVTRPYTGGLPITAPITSTIPPHDHEPGTVIIETPTPPPSSKPPPPSPSSKPAPPSSKLPPPSSKPATSSAKPSSAKPSSTHPSSSSPPPGPTFSCDAGGFLIQRNTLYRLDLATSDNPVIKDRVGTGGNINALGYNILDNFLYAFIAVANSRQQLIRIDATGEATLLPLRVHNGLNVGDIDDQGQFWVSARGNRWEQIDLKPGSKTFGKVVAKGTSPGTVVADWVYLENGGDYLYSIKIGSLAIGARWSRTSHTWETLDDYGEVTPGRGGFGALYAVGDELHGSDNGSGDIFDFPVEQGGKPARKVTDGPATDSNDGARCFKAPLPGISLRRLYPKLTWRFK